ncbi:tol-pal system protein YbgF [Aquabacterium olei]|uniref:Cell division coordinator CpoB n=1 Tax=Aquabacterium olei TaxID=1296669 RepID=A0A2U8FPC4_9BURK|nr:tol-pal system protein YbgF [Aquabacterium olei]AWI52859.1 tol-pal system protein YbgF [Aquabacterium olei]
MTLLPPFALRLRTLALAITAALIGSAAQAALFEDTDARRAILDIRQQRTQDADAMAGKLGALNAQIEQLRRSLLEMNAQVEQLRADLARQRGQDEVLARDLAEVQRKLKDTQASVDERVRKLEPQTLTVDGKTFKVDPDEKRLFDEALARLRAADFAAGISGLNGLLQRYPSTGYRESAWYWLGNAHYGQRQYKEAIASFRQLLDKSPDHARAPESLLSIANCHGELKDNEAARRTLEELVKQYPSTEAAQAARDRLLTMPAAKPAPKKARG